MMQRLTAVFLLLLSVANLQAADPAKAIAKIKAKANAAFWSGEYREALQLNKELADTYRNAGQAYKAQATATKLREARIQVALGQFDNYEATVKDGLDALAAVGGKPSTVYASGLVEAGWAYLEAGNYIQAEEYLSQARENLRSVTESDPLVAQAVERLQLQIWMGEGYYLKGLAAMVDAQSQAKARIVKTEPYVDPKSGQTKVRKLKGSELRDRKRAYAELLNLEAEFHMRRGAYKDALVKLAGATRYIEDQVHKKDVTMVRNLYLRGRTKQLALLPKDATKLLEDALELAGKAKPYKIEPTSRFHQEILDDLLDVLRNSKEDRDAKKLANDFEGKVRRYFGEKSLRAGRELYNDALWHESKGRTEKAEESLAALFNEPKHFPARLLERTEPLLLSMHWHADAGRTAAARVALDDYLTLFTDLLPADCPRSRMAKMEEAIFEIEYGAKLDIAERILVENFDQVLKKELHPQHLHYLRYLDAEAKLYSLTDRYQKAATVLEEAATLAKESYGEKNFRYAVQMEQLGAQYINMGEYQKAREALLASRATFLLPENRKHPGYSYTLRSFGRLYMILGRYDEAEEVLDEALEIAEERGVDFDVEEFTELYLRRGRYSEVEELLRASLDQKSKRYGKHHRSLVGTYHQLAKLYLLTGNYTEAEHNLQAAERIILKGDAARSLAQAENLKVRGQLNREIGDYPLAEELETEVLELQKDLYGRDHIEVANTMKELALVKYFNGRSKEKVEPLFIESREIVQKVLGSNNPSYAEILQDQAYYYKEIGRLDEADRLYDQAHSIWLTRSNLKKNNVQSAEILLNKGDIAKLKRDYKRALGLYEEAATKYRKVFDEQHPDYVFSLSKIGQVQYILGDQRRAIKTIEETTSLYNRLIINYFPAWSERERTQFWNRVKLDFEFYNTLAFSSSERNEAMAANVYDHVLNTKALLLNSSIKVRRQILASGDSSLIAEFKEWQEKKEQLAAALSLSAEEVKDQNISPEALLKDIERLEKSLSTRSEAFSSRQSQAVSWRDVQAKLKPGEYAIEIIRYRHYDVTFTDSVIYAALILSPQTTKGPRVVTLPAGRDLETRYVKNYRNAIKYKVADRISYNIFWAPIHDIVGDNSRIYFSGEGAFNEINLEAISTPDGQYVLDKNTIILVSNTRDLLKPRPSLSSSDKRAVMLANPTLYDIRAGLPEGDSVKVTLADSMYAEAKDEILIEEADGILAKARHGIKIHTEDSLYARSEDKLLIRTEDSLYATEADRIRITESDSLLIPGSTTTYIIAEDGVIARQEDGVLIETTDSVFARTEHRRLIRTEDNVVANAYHNRPIRDSDQIIATGEDRVLIEEKDQITNVAAYRQLKIPQLPGTELEVSQVSARMKKNNWQVEAVTYNEATEEFVKGVRNPFILHVASHAFFSEDRDQDESEVSTGTRRALTNPLLKSGLLLRGSGDILETRENVYEYNYESGVLTAYEAMNLTLDSTQLVMLSACETGRGDVVNGEGVYGLQRSLQVAGARLIVMSLFKVDDKATQELMNEFYSNWLDKNMPIREALIAAKKTIRVTYPEPIYWGSFVMIGLE